MLLMIREPPSWTVPKDRVARAYGLPPADPPGARVLVLGSFPSRLSLARREYYGNPRNHFWVVLGMTLGEAFSPAYNDKLSLLGARGVALWDAAAACVRPGSLDSGIRDAVPNPVPAFLAERPSIRAVAFNGAAAAEIFAKEWAPELRGMAIGEIRFWAPIRGTDPRAFARLPSTSPVPTRSFRSAREKATVWSRFLESYLDRPAPAADVRVS